MATPNIWDKAGRYTIRVDAPAFFEWTLNLPRDQPFFSGWADTRNVPFPAQRDRVRDLVARFDNLDHGGEPWAVVTEIQSEPDALILGRYHGYAGSFWEEQKPDAERGSRYFVSGLVINLTGRGAATSENTWQRAILNALAGPRSFDVASERARSTLTRIENGELGLAILPWIPLMRDGDKKSIIKRWKALGETETDRRKKADYAALARMFAEKGACAEIWQEQLEDWEMEESVVLKQWTEEAEKRAEKRGQERGEKRGEKRGEQKGIVKMMSVYLEQKFGAEGSVFAKDLEKVNDLAKLHKVGQHLFAAAHLDELRALLNGKKRR